MDGPSRVVLVDGNNVIGATPDGWWRDPGGAADRLLARLRRSVPGGDASVVLVLDVARPGVPEGDHGGVAVRYATRRGRDAADDRIVALLDELAAGGAADVEVVTSDRALAARARARGATVTGARTFLARLPRSV